MDHTLVIGTSYKRSSLGQQEALGFTAERLAGVLHAVHNLDFVHEAIVLSTCNRVEFYCYTSDLDACRREITGAYFPDELVAQGALYTMRCERAIRYLFRVASGTESMVFGEREVLSQVRQAYYLAVEEGTTGPIFNKLFQSAVAAGKKVASSTAIRQGRQSVVSVAVETALGLCAKQKPVVGIIGAGKTGAAAADISRKNCIGGLYITNRSPAKGREVAGRHGGEFVPLERMEEILHKADIILTGLSVEKPIIGEQHLKKVREPKYIMDIGVPRNVEPSVGRIPGVTLYNIDDFKQQINRTMKLKRGEMKKILPIIDDEYRRFENWYRYRSRLRGGTHPFGETDKETGDNVRAAGNRAAG